MTIPVHEGRACYLCGIVGDPNAWNRIEQTESTVTVLNGRQFEKGQCMILPLRHAPTLIDLTDSEAAAIMLAAKRLVSALVARYAPNGVLLYQNNGAGSGQEVPHFHLHVVPRTPSSDWGLGPPHLARLDRLHRAAGQDHTVVTELKVQTVAEIRDQLRA